MSGSKAGVLSRLLETEDVLVAPSAYDALSAKVIEATGFKAIGTTGQGASASLLGKPDVGLLTFQEALIYHRNIVSSVSVPVMADVDDGYGGVINVIRTIKEFERIGVAGVYIEDQSWPKKCGAMTGKEVIPIEEATAKIKAAVEARDDPDFLIIARTDAECISIDEAVRRGKAYADAGADLIKPQPHSTEELRTFAKSMKKPLHIGTGIPGLRTHSAWSVDELREIGNVKVVTFPLAACYAATQAVMDLMKVIKKTGSIKGYVDKMIGFADFQKFIGLPAVYETEEHYLGHRRGYVKSNRQT